MKNECKEPSLGRHWDGGTVDPWSYGLSDQIIRVN